MGKENEYASQAFRPSSGMPQWVGFELLSNFREEMGVEDNYVIKYR